MALRAGGDHQGVTNRGRGFDEVNETRGVMNGVQIQYDNARLGRTAGEQCDNGVIGRGADARLGF